MYGVILAGGSGTRFWPISREQSPKQLQEIVGPGTMIQNTVQRLLPLIPIENIFLGTNHKQAVETLRQLDSYNFVADHLIAEPCSRNTALAIGVMAQLMIDKDPDAIMGVFPADHVVTNSEAFIKALQKAETIAQNGYLVTLGIPPTRPETGFGYLKQGTTIENMEGAYHVDRFVEKPDNHTAKQYLEQGNYYWNCGVFVWKAASILKEMQQHAKNIYSQLETIVGCLQTSQGKPGYQELNKKEEKNILICLSTSGNSKNIINVLKQAKSEKIYSISFLGKDGGKAKKISNKSITILSKNTALIQEEHMFMAHYILNSVEEKLS